MINFEISKTQNPTAICLFNSTRVLAHLIMTKSGVTISLCRKVMLLAALRAVSGSAIRRMLTLFRTCCIVFPNVAFACNFARSDSKSDAASRRF